jgi:hypothetical protein
MNSNEAVSTFTTGSIEREKLSSSSNARLVDRTKTISTDNQIGLEDAMEISTQNVSITSTTNKSTDMSFSNQTKSSAQEIDSNYYSTTTTASTGQQTTYEPTVPIVITTDTILVTTTNNPIITTITTKNIPIFPSVTKSSIEFKTKGTTTSLRPPKITMKTTITSTVINSALTSINRTSLFSKSAPTIIRLLPANVSTDNPKSNSTPKVPTPITHVNTSDISIPNTIDDFSENLNKLNNSSEVNSIPKQMKTSEMKHRKMKSFGDMNIMHVPKFKKCDEYKMMTICYYEEQIDDPFPNIHEGDDSQNTTLHHPGIIATSATQLNSSDSLNNNP